MYISVRLIYSIAISVVIFFFNLVSSHELKVQVNLITSILSYVIRPYTHVCSYTFYIFHDLLLQNHWSLAQGILKAEDYS